MKNQKCFLCKSSASKKSIVAAINGFKIYKCHQCNNAITIPKLSIQNLKELYTNKNYRSEDGKRFNPFFEKIFNIFKYLKYLRIKKYIKKKDSILDFGCGDGMLLYFIKKNGNKVKGTEFNISSNKLINGITVPVVNSKRYLT